MSDKITHMLTTNRYRDDVLTTYIHKMTEGLAAI